MNEMMKRIEELEKRVAALEGKAQGQPVLEVYTLEDYDNGPQNRITDLIAALETEVRMLKSKP